MFSSFLNEEEQEAFIILVLIYLWGIWLPILSIKFYQLWQYRYTKTFEKRHTQQILMLYALVVIHICIEQPFSLIILIPSNTFFTSNNLMYDSLTASIIDVVRFIEYTGFILVILSRSWILYHDYRFNAAIANLCWRLELHRSYHEKNWWIKYRHIFGNSKAVIMILCFIWFLFLMVYILIFTADFHILFFDEYDSYIIMLS